MQTAADAIRKLEDVYGHLQLHYEFLMYDGALEDPDTPMTHPYSIIGITRTVAAEIEHFQFKYGFSCWINLHEHPQEDNGYPIYVIDLYTKIRECMDLLATYCAEKLDHEHKNYGSQ